MESSWEARFPVWAKFLSPYVPFFTFCLFQRYAGRILGPYNQETEQKGDQEKREVAPTMSNRLFTAITRLAAPRSSWERQYRMLQSWL